jgi:hypothetical protein
VAFTFTITDATTDTVLDSDSSAVGHSRAHRNHATTSCSATLFLGLASVFFEGSPLPPGVSRTDIIESDLEVEVITKL